MLIQRLGSELQYDNEFIDNFIELVRKNPGSCDAVWFATAYGFPKISVHTENGQKMLKLAEKLRNNNIGVSLQLSNSIGHGEYIKYSKDCSGLIYEGSPVKYLVGHDGTKSDCCFCWRDEFFKKYICDEIKEYLVIKPDYIWIDDDFRARHHGLVKFGCFCDDCVKTFNQENNLTLTREEIVEEILHGDKEIRKKYFKFIEKGLYDFMLEFAKFVHKHSPETVIGLQSASNGAYPCNGVGYLMEAVKEGTGMPGAYRPGGGAYRDDNPNDFLDKALRINFQNATLPDDVEARYPEIENLPFVAFGKTAAGTAFETALYFANGATGMTYSMIMNLREEYNWHERQFELFSKNRCYYDKLIEYNKISHQSGIRFFVAENSIMKPLKKDGDMTELVFENEMGANLLYCDGVPVAYDKQCDDVLFLHADTAMGISDEEIDYLLKKNVITDAKSIEILKEHGYDIGIEVSEMTSAEIGSVTEIYTSHAVNNLNFKVNKLSKFTPGANEAYFMKVTDDTAEILGIYEIFNDFEKRGTEFLAYNNISAVIVTTPAKSKWAVMAYMPWKGVKSSSERNRMMNIADYISDNKISAKNTQPVKSIILPRCGKDGKTVCVSVVNPTIGDMEGMSLVVRNPKSERFMFMAQNEEAVDLDFTKIGHDYNITIPKLKAWNVGTVFCV